MANHKADDAASPWPGGDPDAEPGPQPPISDEPPIEDAEELPGTPRPGQPERPKPRS